MWTATLRVPGRPWRGDRSLWSAAASVLCYQVACCPVAGCEGRVAGRQDAAEKVTCAQQHPARLVSDASHVMSTRLHDVRDDFGNSKSSSPHFNIRH
jgi:hypothetical protein